MSMTLEKDVPAHAARYEELREHVVEGQVYASRLGLVVLLQQGLAAWVEKWSEIPEPTRTLPTERSMPFPLPEECSAQVVHVLTAMVFSHIQEVCG